MAAVITRGYTFGATEEVTNTKLHSLVDSATISSIDRSNFDTATASPVHINASSPGSPSAGNLWFDTTNSIMLEYNGTLSKWVPVARGMVFTNRSGASVAAGDLLILDTANARSVKTTTTANSTLVFGVAASSANDLADVIVITEGYVPTMKVTGSTSIGQYLYTSTTAGKAAPSSTVASGIFAIALTSGATTISAQIGGAALVSSTVNSGFSAVATASSTRAYNAATGSEVISHGLGIVPKQIEVFLSVETVQYWYSVGTCYIVGGSTFSNSTIISDESSNQVYTYNTHCMGIRSGANTNLGAISAATSSNFTVSWTLSGTPGAGTMTYKFLLGG